MNASGVASRNDAKLVCGYPIHLYVGGNGVCTLWSTKGRTELIDKIRDVRDIATLNQSETSVKKSNFIVVKSVQAVQVRSVVCSVLISMDDAHHLRPSVVAQASSKGPASSLVSLIDSALATYRIHG